MVLSLSSTYFFNFLVLISSETPKAIIKAENENRDREVLELIRVNSVSSDRKKLFKEIESLNKEKELELLQIKNKQQELREKVFISYILLFCTFFILMSVRLVLTS